MLIDLSSMLYRAYFAVPDTVRTPKGEPIHAAYGFLNMLARLIENHRPTEFACATDADWRPQWRVDLIEAYKAHRVATSEETEAQEDTIAEQEAVVVGLCDMAGIAVLGTDDWEAEDIIGTLAKRARGNVAIVSGDRDLFQLVEDPRVWVLYPKRGVSDLARVDEAYIASKYGVPGRAYVDFAILRGDPSDGLPGVKGIGEKTATTLIAKYGSLEAVVEAAEREPVGALAKVAAQLDYVERAAKVVRITGEAPCEEADLTLPRHDPARGIEARAAELGLASPIERLLSALRAR
jgi:5'-3' exonuclease